MLMFYKRDGSPVFFEDVTVGECLQCGEKYLSGSVSEKISAVLDSEQIKSDKHISVPVVPVALKTDAWTNGGIIKDFGQVIPKRMVHFSFSEPMMIRDRGNEEHQYIIDFIKRNLSAWK